MPGVFRPYSLVDVLGTMNDQSTDQSQKEIITGLSVFNETSEAFGTSDSMTTSHAAASTEAWGSNTWGTFTWT